jgi:hypothetical protein
MNWASILAYVTGTVDQELLLRNEYLAAENRILKAKLTRMTHLGSSECIETTAAHAQFFAEIGGEVLVAKFAG